MILSLKQKDNDEVILLSGEGEIDSSKLLPIDEFVIVRNKK